MVGQYSLYEYGLCHPGGLGQFGTARLNLLCARAPEHTVSRPVRGVFRLVPSQQTWCSAGRQRTGLLLTLRVMIQLFLYSSCSIWRYSALYGAGKIECGSSPEKKKN